MKNYEEMANNVFKRIDEYEEKKRKKMIVVRKALVAVPVACLTFFLGTFSLKKANIIPEARKSTGERQLVEIVTSDSESPKTVTTVYKETAATTETDRNILQTSLTTVAAETASLSSLNDTVRDTVKETNKASESPSFHNAETAVSTIDNTISEKETTVVVTFSSSEIVTTQTSESNGNESSENKETLPSSVTESAVITTVTAESSTLPMIQFSDSILPWEKRNSAQKYDKAELNYSHLKYHYFEMVLDISSIEDFISDASMSGEGDYPLCEKFYCDAKAFKVKGFGQDVAIAIKFENDEKYYLYHFIN